MAAASTMSRASSPPRIRKLATMGHVTQRRSSSLRRHSGGFCRITPAGWPRPCRLPFRNPQRMRQRRPRRGEVFCATSPLSLAGTTATRWVSVRHPAALPPLRSLRITLPRPPSFQPPPLPVQRALASSRTTPRTSHRHFTDRLTPSRATTTTTTTMRNCDNCDSRTLPTVSASYLD